MRGMEYYKKLFRQNKYQPKKFPTFSRKRDNFNFCHLQKSFVLFIKELNSKDNIRSVWLHRIFMTIFHYWYNYFKYALFILQRIILKLLFLNSNITTCIHKYVFPRRRYYYNSVPPVYLRLSNKRQVDKLNFYFISLFLSSCNLYAQLSI